MQAFIEKEYMCFHNFCKTDASSENQFKDVSLILKKLLNSRVVERIQRERKREVHRQREKSEEKKKATMRVVIVMSVKILNN